MKNHLVNFENMDWVNTETGIRFKVFIHKNQRLRLIEFPEGFIDLDWCTSSHVGYVIEGKFTTDFDGHLETYKKGDIIFIPSGPMHKHKTIIGNEKVLLLSFELIKNY